MKKIEAIIRKSKFEDVKKALHEVGIDFFTYWDATGVGRSTEKMIFRGQTIDTSKISRTMLSIVVRDHNLQKTVDAILSSARTGELGDGKIFISDMEEVYRIRNGEKGPEALFIKGEEE
ncbi:MAG: P-II family nitrogen regulator [Bacteroidales bacterium]